MEERYASATDSPLPGDNAASAGELRIKRSRTAALVCYILQGAAFFIFITFIAALIVGYIERPKAEGTWVHSHFTWQIKTFWWSLLCIVIIIMLGGAFAHTFMGAIHHEVDPDFSNTFLTYPPLVLLASLAFIIWFIYRIVKGMIRLFNGQPI